MKKLLAITLILIICSAALVGCGSASEAGGNRPSASASASAHAPINDNPTERKQVSQTVVPATCLTEGYVERVYDDGYVCRDTFTPTAEHDYVKFSLGSEKTLTREICRNCGKEKIAYTPVTINTDVVIDRNRTRPSFAGLDVMACAMIMEPTPDDAIVAIRRAEATGAFGFMIYLTSLEQKYVNQADLERIMYCTDKPVLVIAYAATDEVRESWYKTSIAAGAAAVDMPGYMYEGETRSGLSANKQYWEGLGFDMSFVARSPREVSGVKATIDRQAAFISEIHALGGEVLISTHANVTMSAEQIHAMGVFLSQSGADIVKMVLGGSDKNTVIEHLKACILLKEDAAFTAKFSVHGQSTLSRLMCPMFGSYIAFCVDEYNQQQTNIQIDLKTMVDILNSPEMKGVLQ